MGIFKEYNIMDTSLTQASLHNASKEAAEMRRATFVAAIPSELSKREDDIQINLAKENASSRSKLRKIYNLMADLGKVAEPYIACGKGCSSCCKMNVKISQLEANQIGEKIGKKAKMLIKSKNYSSNEFIGIACIFLKDDACTIYDVRPFVCRKHIWFDTSAYWCDPSRSLDVTMPMIEFSGALGAFFDVTMKDGIGVHADIRDFF